MTQRGQCKKCIAHKKEIRQLKLMNDIVIDTLNEKMQENHSLSTDCGFLKWKIGVLQNLLERAENELEEFKGKT